MNKTRLRLAAALIVALPLLQACVPAVVATGAAVGVMSVTDRRQTGVQAEDEAIEWKAAQSVPQQYAAAAHLNFTAFNKYLLVTGEVSGEEAKNAIGIEAAKVAGVRGVYNETLVGPASTLTARSNDSYITSKVKARLVDTNQLSANHIKVLSERGIVYLMGIVNEREAKVAVAVARTTAGVAKVVNVLEIVSEDETRRLDNQVLGSRTAPPQSAPVETR